MNANKERQNKGFTLAELLVVVAIIGVLTGISVPVFNSQLERSREATDLANVRSAYAELMVAASTDDKSAKYNGTTIYDSTEGAYIIKVPLKQKQAKWSTSLPINLGGVESASDNDGDNGINWLHSPTGKDNEYCKLYYKYETGLIIDWTSAKTITSSFIESLKNTPNSIFTTSTSRILSELSNTNKQKLLTMLRMSESEFLALGSIQITRFFSPYNADEIRAIREDPGLDSNDLNAAAFMFDSTGKLICGSYSYKEEITEGDWEYIDEDAEMPCATCGGKGYIGKRSNTCTNCYGMGEDPSNLQWVEYTVAVDACKNVYNKGTEEVVDVAVKDSLFYACNNGYLEKFAMNSGCDSWNKTTLPK
ncbi:MAG: prepilin-type N-terminal cleavage/methylation domain-containing protein [Erysipelotrichaceae bacterium]|nr:prepilin-type N-terminal cleavage/methylation domain-containing protein [Erysipelotrichaceae bacterium]